MDFPQEFVALRARLEKQQGEAFHSRQNITIADRTAALFSSMENYNTRKMLGLFSLNITRHANQYRLLFAQPTFQEDDLNSWWEYTLQVAQELVQPDETHDFSIVSLIIAVESCPRVVQKKLNKLSCEQTYGVNGWSSVHMAIIDFSSHTVYTNRMGAPLKNILNPLLK